MQLVPRDRCGRRGLAGAAVCGVGCAAAGAGARVAGMMRSRRHAHHDEWHRMDVPVAAPLARESPFYLAQCLHVACVHSTRLDHVKVHVCVGHGGVRLFVLPATGLYPGRLGLREASHLSAVQLT